MIKDKISQEMKLQGFNQAQITRAINKLGKDKALSQPQLSYYLSGKKGLSVHHIESLFEVLGITLIRIL